MGHIAVVLKLVDRHG